MHIMERLDYRFLGNPLWAWILTAALTVIILGLVGLAKRFLSKPLPDGGALRSFSQRVLRRLAGTGSLLLGVGLSLWIACLVLSLAPKTAFALHSVAVLLLAAQGARWIHALIGLLAEESEARAEKRDPGATTSIRALGLCGKVLLWTLLILFALHNAGVNITALVAGLGIGGVAVALALQNILADVFSSIAIIMDKPYQVGDFIVVGDSMGFVARIGLKTTRLRSLSGEQLIFSNAEVLKMRIRNFNRMTERRVEFTIGVSYQTPHSKVEQVPSMLRDIIIGVERTRFERAHFKEFGESSLTFECVYFVTEFSYALYLSIQETINLEILRRFQEQEIEFAQPGKILYVAHGVAPVRW